MGVVVRFCATAILICKFFTAFNMIFFGFRYDFGWMHYWLLSFLIILIGTGLIVINLDKVPGIDSLIFMREIQNWLL